MIKYVSNEGIKEGVGRDYGFKVIPPTDFVGLIPGFYIEHGRFFIYLEEVRGKLSIC